MADQKLKEVISNATAFLNEAGVDSPALSAQLFAEQVFALSRVQLIIELESVIDSAKAVEFDKLVKRRAAGEPVAYILGVKEFFGFEFKVGPGVLIPRPETEEIVEKVQVLFGVDHEFLFADFGTGSGILAITVAKLFPNARGVAVDLSPAALDIARKNARLHGVSDRVQFVLADFNKSLLADAKFELILANPPYLCEAELDEISSEVADYEPVSALVSGPDGDEDIRGCAPRIARALTQGGKMFMEIGYLQGRVAHDIFDSCAEFSGCVEVLKDLSGHDRIVVAKKK